MPSWRRIKRRFTVGCYREPGASDASRITSWTCRVLTGTCHRCKNLIYLVECKNCTLLENQIGHFIGKGHYLNVLSLASVLLRKCRMR